MHTVLAEGEARRAFRKSWSSSSSWNSPSSLAELCGQVIRLERLQQHGTTQGIEYVRPPSDLAVGTARNDNRQPRRGICVSDPPYERKPQRLSVHVDVDERIGAARSLDHSHRLYRVERGNRLDLDPGCPEYSLDQADIREVVIEYRHPPGGRNGQSRAKGKTHAILGARDRGSGRSLQRMSAREVTPAIVITTASRT